MYCTRVMYVMKGFAMSAQVMLRLMWVPTMVLPDWVSSDCCAEVWKTIE